MSKKKSELKSEKITDNKKKEIIKTKIINESFNTDYSILFGITKLFMSN